MQQIWKTQQWPREWKRSVFIPIPKKGNAEDCSNYHTITLILRTSKAMLKILQVRLQQVRNWELPDVQAGLRKGRGIRDQTVNIHWIIEKAREFQKIIYFCFIHQGFPGGSDDKASACNAGDLGSIPWSWRSPGEGNGNPLQYSCLENSVDGGVCWATVHGVTKSWTWLSNFTSLLLFHSVL